MNRAVDGHRRLIERLRDPACWPDEVGPDLVIETHISTVLLVGRFAYKIKKPLNLGFLDFSTLTLRHHFCEEEIRLNGRLAPDVYLDVVPISGTHDAPRLFGKGRAIEYAVRMRRFDQAGLLSEHLDRVTPMVINRLAERLAAFHTAIDTADSGTEYGDPGRVPLPMRENFIQIRALIQDRTVLSLLEQLADWTERRFEQLEPLLRERKLGGFIRECHGDLHLGNIALEGDDLLIFDGIEFNPALRWIDVISELAFLLMDLDEKGLQALSQRLLNRYLELSGDYTALPLLRFYQVYRAMVRAKVTAIRLAQGDLLPAEHARLDAEFNAYLQLARRYTASGSGGVIITHGFSGSGKSTGTLTCLEQLSAVRVRSDVERRRLAGIAADQASHSVTDGGIYQVDFSRRTYARLEQLAGAIAETGWVAIVDATFLRRDQRQRFQQRAEALQIPFLILDFRLPEAQLRQRIAKRQRQGTDPSEATLAVLEKQLETAQPLTVDELKQTLSVESDHLPMDEIRARLKR
ncbi:AAA family ATPase [Sedimenticola sp.]|uniref:bifunctional aminoglycoside phosphotransferase/ATP-binding protein n=1 Tax=Sedimenticola sp. TaxID=1940285 RepID=UPI003D0BD179